MTFSYWTKPVILLLMIGVTPSCIKYHQLFKSEFPQGEDAPDVRDVAHRHVRSTTVYDQFTTLAVFDALWLSPEINKTYLDMYGKRRGKSATAHHALAIEQEEDSSEFMSFYVLADLRVKTHKGLHEKGSYWTMALENSAGKRLEAVSIKNVDIDPEYQTMFAYRFNLFKEVYLVKFPVKVEDKPFFEAGEPITMLLSSPRKNMRISWDSLKTGKKLFKNHDNCDWF